MMADPRDIQLYLKYFHGGKASLEETLQQVDEENKMKEEGVVDAEHIDQLHPDEKEEGGVERTIEIGFTSRSYKSAKRAKNQGKFHERIIKIRQDKYSNTGNAWKVWDSAMGLARWCYGNRYLFRDKVVHEVGAGCGLSGLIVADYCKQAVLSDYKEEILRNLEHNVQLNYENRPHNITVKLLDFEKVANDPAFRIPEEERVDIMLASDVVYGIHLAGWLPKVVDQLLKPNGIFYGVNPKSRWGFNEFIDNMEAMGYTCMVSTLPELYCEDFARKSFWDLFAITKMTRQQYTEYLQQMQQQQQNSNNNNSDGANNNNTDKSKKKKKKKNKKKKNKKGEPESESESESSDSNRSYNSDDVGLQGSLFPEYSSSSDDDEEKLRKLKKVTG